jgi:sugar lactone lactonase YvrE
MKQYKAEILVDGLAFPEGPRWYGNHFWFTDQHARRVYRLDTVGNLETITATDDLPGGLGWLPDGRMLVVYMIQRKVMQWDGQQLKEYADLSGLASFHCNDMLVDPEGRVYVGNFGFDLHGGAQLSKAEIVMIDVYGKTTVFSDDVIFPNGFVFTADHETLVVAESFAHRLTGFELDVEGFPVSSFVWAELGDMTPDGICMDQNESIWVASPGTNEVTLVKKGGDKIAACMTTGTPYACMLGGEDGQTLYICTSETDDPEQAASIKSGRIERVRIGY